MHDTTSAQAQPTGRAPIGHDPSTMPGAPIPVRALSLSPRHFDDKEESPISSPRTNATAALLALCGQLESSSPRFSPSSPRSSPRFSPRLSPAAADAAFEEERRVARVHLEASFARFYDSVERPAPSPGEWKRTVLGMEEAAWAGCGGAIERYWLLLRQAVSIAVAEHCSPLVGRAEGASAAGGSDDPGGRGSALKQSSPSAVQKLTDATPSRAAKRRKSAQGLGGGRRSGASGTAAQAAAVSNGISPKAASVPWTDEEDMRLKAMVESTGTKWTIIGNRLKRTGKQCRERWCNHVDPAVSHEPWSDEEDRILIQAQKDLGNQWVEIAKLLPGRPYVPSCMPAAQPQPALPPSLPR